MHNYSRKEIIDKIEELRIDQDWNHSIELLDGISTSNPTQNSKGKNLIKWNRIEPIIANYDLKNKNVLDIGSNDGFFSMKFAEKGAIVTSLEVNKDRIKKQKFVFSVKSLSDKITILEKSIYDLKKVEKNYDLVLCMGFIHRVPDLISVIKLISEVSESVLLEFKALPEYAYDRPFLYYDGRLSDSSDIYSTCFLIPSVSAVIKIANNYNYKYFDFIGSPMERRVMLTLSKNFKKGFAEKTNLRPHSKIYMFKKYTRRFVSDILDIFSLKS